MQMVWVMNKVLSGWFSWKMDSILGKGPRGSMIQDFARSFFVRNSLTIVKVRQFLIF